MTAETTGFASASVLKISVYHDAPGPHESSLWLDKQRPWAHTNARDGTRILHGRNTGPGNSPGTCPIGHVTLVHQPPIRQSRRALATATTAGRSFANLHSKRFKRRGKGALL